MCSHAYPYWQQDPGCKTQLCYRSSALPVVDHVKDHGVIIDEQLMFHLHINHIVASVFTRANLILKCFTSRHDQTLLHAFKIYVLPVIEYASSFWSPHYAGDIQKVERVQRKFTSQVKIGKS